MPHFQPSTALAASLLAFSALILGACGSPAPSPVVPSKQALPKQYFQIDLGDGFRLDYAVERKASNVNSKACYAFITGSVSNATQRTLSRHSILDVIVMEKGKMSFRDLTNPVADIPPGGSAMIRMVDSPVHKDGCPDYERIDVSLRKTFVN